LQQKITAKKEFNEKGSLPYEELPKRGQFYNHQEFVHRYIIPYNELALFHRTGTGKTGAAIGGADAFRRTYVDGVISYVENYVKPQRTFIKQAFIIVGNKHMKKQIVDQIVCKISQPGDYDLEEPEKKRRGGKVPKKEKVISDDTYENRIRKQVSQFYKIKTVGEFVNMLTDRSPTIEITSKYVPETSGRFTYHIDRKGTEKKLPKGFTPDPAIPNTSRRFRTTYTMRDMDFLVEEFSGTLFIYDELHNLRQNVANLFDFDVVNDAPSTDSNYDKSRNYFRYSVIHALFSKLKRFKRIILTATPAINTPSEFSQIMNIILTPGPQLPDNIDWDSVSMDRLYPYFRGRVSYVRETTIQINAKYIGTNLGTKYKIGNQEYQSQTIIDRNVMSNRQRIDDGTVFVGQANVYSELLRKISEKTTRKSTKGQDKRKEGAFFGAQLQVSNFVFPDGSYGGKESAYGKYVSESGGLKAKPELKPWLKIRNDVPFNTNPDLPVPKHLRLLSPKYAKIIQDSIDAKGNVFVYSNMVRGSGANVLALSYEENGFLPFHETTSVFIPTFSEETGKSVRSFCRPTSVGKSKGKGREVRPGLFGINRYALLTSYTPKREFKIALETFNSWENRHGEILKVLIISPIGGEGLDTANVVDIHIINSNWNEASTYQEISRAIRSGGHDSLWYEKVAEILNIPLEMVMTKSRLWLDQYAADLGISLDDIKVDVSIHLHASIRPDEAMHTSPAVEPYLYSLSENKDIRIKRIFRMIKQMAIDGYINMNRNIKPEENDYSAICDYSTCKYSFYDPPPTEIDYTSYDVLYLDQILEPIMKEIQEIYKIHRSLTFVKLQRILVNQAAGKQAEQRRTLKYLGPAEGELVDLHNYLPKFIELAIQRLITQQVRIPNRYGITCYLAEMGDVIYLRDGFDEVMGMVKRTIGVFQQSSSRIEENMGESLYATYLVATQNIPFSEFSLRIKEGMDIESKEKFLSADLSSLRSQQEKFDFLEKIFRTLSEETQEHLYEQAVIDNEYSKFPPDHPRRLVLSPDRTSQIEFLKSWYRTQDFWFVEPTAEFNSKETEENYRKRDLAALTPEEAVKMNAKIEADKQLAFTQPMPLVFIHSLESSRSGDHKAKHNILQKRRKAAGKIRVLKLSEITGWRDATPKERYVYNKYLQSMDYKQREPFESHSKVYGILNRDGVFYLVNNLDSPNNAGGECVNYVKSVLMDVLWYLQVPPPDIIIAPSVTYDMMKVSIARKGYKNLTMENNGEGDRKKVEYAYRIVASGKNERTHLCSMILNFMLQEEVQGRGQYLWRL
jgi:hypothetical protein